MPKAFSKAAIKYFGQVYDGVQRGSNGGCMVAAFRGAGALFGADYSFRGSVQKQFQDTAALNPRDSIKNEFDDWLHFLEGRGVTVKVGEFRPIRRGKWNLNNETIITSIEDYLVNVTLCMPGDTQYFGIALSGGVHSLNVRVEKETGQVFWMDQNSKGYNKDFTDKLDSEIRDRGGATTRIWHYDPEAADGVEVPIDTTGDGNYDSTAPAVDEVPDETCLSPLDDTSKSDEPDDDFSSQLIAPTADEPGANHGVEVLLAQSGLSEDQLMSINNGGAEVSGAGGSQVSSSDSSNVPQSYQQDGQSGQDEAGGASQDGQSALASQDEQPAHDEPGNASQDGQPSHDEPGHASHDEPGHASHEGQNVVAETPPPDPPPVAADAGPQ